MSAGPGGTRWLRPAAAGCAAALLTGCASSAPPVEAVPALDTRLTAVDRAIADHEYREARRQIQRLVDTTTAARESGLLERDEAEPILAAAESLTSALPPQRPGRSASPEPDRAPGVDEGNQAPEPRPDAGLSEEEREQRQKELEKQREELQKKREQLQKQLEEQRKHEEEGGGEEGGGNGNSGSNGPDDGHGG